MKKVFWLLSLLIFTVNISAQYVQQGGKLAGTGTDGMAMQGSSLAVSADGNTAIAGGPNDNDMKGAAWVYIKSGGVWQQQGDKLVGTGSVGRCDQGKSVSISGDGNIAVVGGIAADNFNGAVWVFERTGGVWAQTQKLFPSDASAEAQLGSAVDISADGSTIMVGATHHNSSKGACWIYKKEGGQWVQKAKLEGTGAVGNTVYQGYSVALSADGTTAVTGAVWDNSCIGAVWVFQYDGVSWNQKAKLIGSDYQQTPYQGRSVDVSADGNTIIAGASNDNGGVGAAWIYFNNGSGNWIQQGNKITGTSQYAQPGKGSSVALTSDGNTAFVGGFNEFNSIGAVWVYTKDVNTGIWSEKNVKLTGTATGSQTYLGNTLSASADGSTVAAAGANDHGGTGAVWFFHKSGETWAQQGEKRIGTGAIGGGNQGKSVSVSADGNTLISGANRDHSDRGAAWIFERSGGSWQQAAKLVGSGSIGDSYQGYSVAVSADGNTAAVGGSQDNFYKGAVWVFVKTNGSWTEQAKLTGTGLIGTASLGRSVDISADGNTIIAGASSDNSSIGAALVFTRSGTSWSQQAKLTAPDALGTPVLGQSVAISDDGNTAIVGGYNDNSGKGASFIFVRSGSSWAQQGTKLVGSDAIGNSQQGWSVGISQDGNTAIAGSFVDNSGRGAAWIFVRSGTSWAQQGSKIAIGTLPTNTYYGYSVALSGSGNTAVIGGYADNGFKGALWVYTRENSNWQLKGNKLAGTGYSGNPTQGSSCAISADGSTIVSGGPGDATSNGAVWVFYEPVYTITASAGANGTISPSGTASVQSGGSKTYTIQPNANYAVQDVLVDGVSQGAITTYTFTNVTASHTISATFTSLIDNSITVPVIAYPSGGIMVYTNSPVISWYTLKRVPSLKYRVQAASDAAFTNVVFDQANVSAQYTFLSGLSSGTQYYLRVRGVAASGSIGAWSQPAVFRTVAAPGQVPLVPTIVYPAGGATVLTDQPMIVWYISAYGPGLKYNLQLSTTADFSNIVVNQSNITNTTYNASGLSAGSTYYARVRSYTPQGLYSAFSPAESFTVNQMYGTQSITPVIVYPSGGSTVFATSFAMTWMVPGYAPSQTLNLQVSTRSDFATFVVNQENLTGSSYILNGLTYGTTYYARIRGKSQSGSYSLFSDIVPFTVVSENWLVSPIAGSPVEDVELTTSNALLSWYTPSAEGSPQVRYDLQVSSNAGFTQPQNITGIVSPSYELAGLKGSTKYYWRVRSRREDGKISPYSNEGVFVTAKELKVTDVNQNTDQVPGEYALRQNYPNPFNPATTIEFSLKSSSHARLEVIDMLGRRAATLVDEYLSEGTYTVKFNAESMPSGIYFYKLTAPGVNIVKKMILSK